MIKSARVSFTSGQHKLRQSQHRPFMRSEPRRLRPKVGLMAAAERTLPRHIAGRCCLRMLNEKM